ncbi:MAG: DNRLRE domain-containing protein [Verrucomicrobia bacterium]|nr:DNRLRE domain-containing protein [Verrucomicrobiota bacterium]
MMTVTQTLPLRAVNALRVLTLAWALPLAAASYELSPVQDARILAFGFENTNFGQDILSVYTQEGNVQRTLLQFDLSHVVLAPTERLGSATLRLYASVSFGASGGQPMEVFAVARPWSEGGVTWLHASAAAPWSRKGGDYLGVGWRAEGEPWAVNSASVTQDGPVTWDVRELVDQWVEGAASNHGLLLKSNPGNGLTFAQRETSSMAQRPVLIVFTEPGPPRLRAEREPGTGNVRLSWRGTGNATLQERAALVGGAAWADSGLPVAEVEGRSVVNAPLGAAARWYRLRSN